MRGAVRQLSESPALRTSDERRDLRDAVAQLAGRYGRAYFQETVREGCPPEALWRELGRAGFLSAHLAEEYGGGGGGFADTAIVIEEIAAQGCPIQMVVISPTICGCILQHHGS